MDIPREENSPLLDPMLKILREILGHKDPPRCLAYVLRSIIEASLGRKPDYATLLRTLGVLRAIEAEFVRHFLLPMHDQFFNERGGNE